MMNNNPKKEVLLKVRNVKKFFHTPSGVLRAIDDVSFDVREGEIVGLIGESGSGKTTVGRCLIRLYEEYSGLVSLNNQVISGQKLTKSKRLFLNQNMQMIFQDPHASLNGQQNIYSILKEPLMVNKIMKNEYADFFSDWDDVKQNFRYTFAEEMRKLELNTIEFHVQEAKKFLEEWRGILEKIKFKYIDIENDFNLYFGYLLSQQIRESNVVSKMFENNSKILDLYYKNRDEYRNDSILFIEQELKKAKQELTQTIEHSKISEFEYNKIKSINEKKKELSELEEIYKSTIQNSKNIINSYLKEFKNNYQSHIDSANAITSNFQQYNEQIKHYLLFKKMYHILKTNKLSISFLSGDEIDELISDFKQYKENFASSIDLNIGLNHKDYRKQVKNYIDKKFKYSFSKKTIISKKIQNVLEEKIHNLNSELKSLKIMYAKYKDGDDSKPAKNQEDIVKAQKQYNDLKNKYEQETKEYEISFEKRMDNYRAKMIKAHEELFAIREELKVVDKVFQEKHNEFILGLQNFLLAKQELPKKIKNKVNLYQNKILTKKESLKAFEVEVKNLNKDHEKLKHLLGLEKNILSKKYVKKILLKEKIYRALEEVGLLRQFVWRYPHEFSGGQRQRIVIARALISNPKIIIADEPIASLDVSIQAQVVNILKSLCEKKNVSLIFIAHDLSMVEYIADNILIMHLGKIVESGKTEEIYNNPKHPYTINLFKSIPKISNANDKFEASSFELDYLDIQKKDGVYVDFFKLNENHDIYSTIEQFKEWTNSDPQPSKFTKHKGMLEKKLISNSKS